MPQQKAKKRNRALRSSNDHNVGEKRPYSVVPDSMEVAVALTPEPLKQASKISNKKLTSEENLCDNRNLPSKDTSSAILKPLQTIEPVYEHAGVNDSAIADTEKKVRMSAQQEKFLQELEKLVKMGETSTASVIHESVTGVDDDLHPNQKEESKEAAYWKARFDEMSNLRLTEPEKELEKYRKHAEEKARAQDELIQELRRCNAEFSEDNLKLVAPAVEPVPPAANGSIPTNHQVDNMSHPIPNNESVPSQSSIDELELKLARKRTILAMYQQLTGICIKFKEEGWIECTALNHLYKRTLQFNLKIPEDEDDCSSKEVNFRPGANSHILPSYMQHSLVFERNQSPLFLVKILTCLFHEE